jgi:subtilisin family serine protease
LRRYRFDDNVAYGIQHRYSIGRHFVGYAASLPSIIVNNIHPSDIIKSVEKNEIVHINWAQTDVRSWGLSRISKRTLPIAEDNYFYPDRAGAGTHIYVIDTGIQVDHPEFEGRATFGAAFTENELTEVDGNGHGTHCAGTVASKSYGVAKKANVIAVKVLDTQGSGSYAGVIAGINWAVNDAVEKGYIGKSAASMSLGGGRSNAVNDAVAAGVRAGLPFTVAAGNSYKSDACNYSPASEPSAYTVGASDSSDKLAYFSNIGPCVDIIAPGVDILSTWINSGTLSISGTSMATPHVAGVFALALAEKKFNSPNELYEFVSSIARPRKIKNLSKRTVNLLLQNGFESFPTTPRTLDGESVPIPVERPEDDVLEDEYESPPEEEFKFPWDDDEFESPPNDDDSEHKSDEELEIPDENVDDAAFRYVRSNKKSKIHRSRNIGRRHAHF